MRRMLALLKTQIQVIFRDPILIFFDLVLPAAMFLFFASVFAPSPSSGVTDVYLIAAEGDSRLEEALRSIEGAIRVHRANSNDVSAALQDALSRYRDPLIVRLPSDWADQLKSSGVLTVEIWASRGNPMAAFIGQAIGESLAQQLGYAIQSPVRPVLQPLERARSGVDGVLLTTLITAWLIVGGMHAVTQYAYLRESGLSKRLRISPLCRHEFILALIAESWLISLVVSAELMFLGIVLYQSNLIRAPVDGLWLLAGCGLLVCISASIGLLVASLSREPSYSVLGPLVIYMSLMFLSGLAIPVMFFPGILQQIASWLPPRRLHVILGAVLLFREPSPAVSALLWMGALAVVLLVAVVQFTPWRTSRR